ncbi:MAG: dephospho-CoA kinase [Nanoarchaeota archaeon]|nr:dephospho-CoA kinase [Nanoarchaeota archaeon]MBU1704748.1 dephospho-CoA kinase [Nanoarchaeota archaeon]
MLIGLTGTMASGKGTVAEYLKNKGFEGYVFSDVIKEEARKRGLEITRENLQKTGDALRKEHKNEGILAKKLLLKIKSDKAFVDGARNADEIHELRKRKDFVLIAVDAPQKVRFERLKSRGRSGDPKTFEDFKKLDDLENKKLGGGQEINKCMALADHKIENTGDVKELIAKIEKILSLLE